MAFVKLEESEKNHEIMLLVFRLEEKVSPIPSHGSDILYTSFRLALSLSLISQIILSHLLIWKKEEGEELIISDPWY